MIQFILGLAVGSFITLAAIALTTAGADDPEEFNSRLRADQPTERKCRGCVYQMYDKGLHDCSVCHEAGET